MLTNVGYYIHSCIKMRYKAAYRPQYILGELALSQLNIMNGMPTIIRSGNV